MPARFSYKNDSQADSRANPVTLREAERSRLADIERGFGKDADPGQENSNIQKLRQGEAAGSKSIPFVNMDSIRNKASKLADKTAETALGPWGKVYQKLRKNGPGAGLIGGGLLIFGFIVFSPLSNPLISFAQTSTEARANASRSQAVVFAKKMEYTVNNDKVAAACAKNVGSNACKRGTLSKRQKELYESSKFKVDAEEVGGRYLIKSFTTPDGVKIDSGKKFSQHLSNDLDFARLVGRVHNVRALVFNGGRMLKRVLIPFGLNKIPIKENAPKDPAERKKFFGKLFGIGDEGTIDEEKAKEKIKVKANELGRGLKAGSRATGAAAVVGATCTLYNGAHLALNVAKAQRFITALQIITPFLKAGSQIRDNGAIEPDTVSALGDQVTARDESGQSAMDAPEVKELFGAKNTGVSNALQAYLLFNNPILQNADNIIKTIDNGIASAPGLGGAKTARAICREVNSWKTAAAQLAICGIGTAAGSAVPVAGNAVGFVSACAVPMIAGFAASFAMGTIASQLFEHAVLPWVVETAIAGLPNADIIGPPLGTILGIGAATLMNNVNRSNGLVPLKKKALVAYNNAISDSEHMYKETQIADARATPFDINNKYSFLGSIANTITTRVIPDKSRIESGNLAFQRLFGSWSLIPSALAIGESQSIINADNLQSCQDSTVRNMGYECDSSDANIYGNSPEALTMSEQANIDYLKQHHYVDDETEGPTAGSDLEKFVTYCTDNNEMGITAESIESEDYDWSTKEACGEESEKMSNFQRYVLSEASIEDSEMSEGEGGSGIGLNVMSYNVLGTKAGSVNNNDAGIPWRDRLNNAVSAVKNANPDIAGFQEVTGAGSVSQFDLLKKGLSDSYTGFPTKEMSYSSRVIYWKSDGFSLVDSGTYSYHRNGITGTFPWVKLSDNKTSKEFYVFNTHTSAGNDKAKERRDQARKIVEAIKKVAPPGSSVIATGDFNSTCEVTGNDKGVSLAEIPCTIMREAGFEDAGEAAYQQNAVTNYEYSTSHGETDSLNKRANGIGRHIDHVFYTGDISVQHWENIINDDTRRASDHTPVVATLSMAAPAASAASGECPAGTTLVNGITDGWVLKDPRNSSEGIKKAITLCAIPGTRIIDSSATQHWSDARYKGTTAAKIKQIVVNSEIAADTLKMAQAAKSQGHTLSATVSYRSLYEQCSIVAKIAKKNRPVAYDKNCPSWITPVPGNWTSRAIFSNHMMGYSIDVTDSSYAWIKKNGERFGFIDDVYRTENWDKKHFTNKPKSVDTR